MTARVAIAKQIEAVEFSARLAEATGADKPDSPHHERWRALCAAVKSLDWLAANAARLKRCAPAGVLTCGQREGGA